MLSDDLLRKTIAILHNLRISDGVISRETVIAIGNWVLNSNCPEKLTRKRWKCDPYHEMWSRNLKRLDWVKIRGTAAKREIKPTFYEDLTFTLKRKISNAISKHSIYDEMSLNFNLTPLGYTEPNKATFGEKDAQSLSKCQIVGTFCVKISRFY